MKRRSVGLGFIGILFILFMFAYYRARLAPITARLHDTVVVDIGRRHMYGEPLIDLTRSIVLQNNRPFPQAIGGWSVHTAHCQYVIPSDRTIAPFWDVHIWAGSGQEDGVNLYAGCSFDRWPMDHWPMDVDVCPDFALDRSRAICHYYDYPQIITTLGQMRLENVPMPVFYEPPGLP